MKKPNTNIRNPKGILFTNDDFEIWNRLERSACYVMGIFGAAIVLAFGVAKIADYAMYENSVYVTDDEGCHGVKDIYDLVKKHSSVVKVK